MKRYSVLIVLVIICLITVYKSFYGLGLIANSDSYLGLNAIQLYKEFSYAWNDRYNGGFESTFTPYALAMGLPALLNQLNSAMSNAGMVAVVLLVSWFALFALVEYLIDTKGKLSLVVTFFTLSSFIITSAGNRVFIVSVTNILWGTMFSVLGIYFFLRAFHENSFIKLVLCYIMIAATFIDTASAILLVLFFILYLLFHLTFFDNKKNTFIFCLKNLLLGISLNSYWLVFSILRGFSSVSRLASFTASVSDTDAILGYISAISNNAFALILSRENYFSSPSYPKHFFPIELGLNVLMFILAASSMFFVGREKNSKLRKDIIVFLVIFLLFLLLGFGPHDPFDFFNYLWTAAPFFRIFRDYFKFHRILQILFVVLSAYSVSKIFEKYVRNNWVKLLTALLSFAFLSLFLPYMKLYPYYKPYKVPDYYFDLVNYVKGKDEVGALAVLPTINWHQTYNWSNKNYDMPDPFYILSPIPAYTNLATYTPSPAHYINQDAGEAIVNKREQLFYNLCRIRNIRYVIIRKDFYPPFLQKRARYGNFNIALNYDMLISNIDKFKFISKPMKFGDLNLYELGDQVFSPILYSPKELTISDGDIVHSSDIFSDTSAVVYTSDNPDNSFENLKGEFSAPKIEFRKINPSRYELKILDAKGSFPLILSTAYNPEWKVFIKDASGGEKLGDTTANIEFVPYFKTMYKQVPIASPQSSTYKSIQINGVTQNNMIPSGNIYDNWFNTQYLQEDSHYTSNGFSNLWFVDTPRVCNQSTRCKLNPDGTYSLRLSIEFRPQKYAYIGLGVTFLLVSTILVLSLVIHVIRSKR